MLNNTPMRIYETQTRKQAHRIVEGLLSQEKGRVFDCIQARRFVIDKYGLDMDHHEYTYVLDHLYQRGAARLVGMNEFSSYEILA